MTQKKPPYQAPQFSLEGSDGMIHRLEDYKGYWLVLYFYPQDDTPGCTVEACSMRDQRDDLAKHGAMIVGVSRDSLSSHEKFRAKYSLNFTLLSDPDNTVHEKYGAWGSKMFGKIGPLRKTFLIDPEGIVRKVYGKVNPLGHGQKIVEDLVELKNASEEKHAG